MMDMYVLRRDRRLFFSLYLDYTPGVVPELGSCEHMEVRTYKCTVPVLKNPP